MYFNDSWKKRASGVRFCVNLGVVMRPPLLETVESDGCPSDGWLNGLKISVRNCNVCSRLAAMQGSAALALYFASGLSRWGFAGLWSAFGLLWLFAMPFHVRLAMTADPKGRVAMLVPAAQLLGTAFGPLLSSFFVTETQPRLVALICACFALSAAVLVAMLGPLLRRSRGDEQPVAALPADAQPAADWLS